MKGWRVTVVRDDAATADVPAPSWFDGSKAAVARWDREHASEAIKKMLAERGAKGGRKGGRSRSRKKVAAARRNALIARASRIMKRAKKSTTKGGR